jgi:hypothetical protein
MCVTITQLLFLNSEGELPLRLTPTELRKMGRDLKGRMDRAAVLAQQVVQAGGQVKVSGSFLECVLPGVRAVAEAEARLRLMGVDLNTVSIYPDPSQADEPALIRSRRRQLSAVR